MKNTENVNLPFLPEELDDFIASPSAAVVREVGTWDTDIIVLGAGGKMGLHVCVMLKRALEKSGSRQSITAVSRFGNLMDRDDFESRGIPTIAGDLRDEAFLASLPEAGIVFFLAGAKFGTADNPQLLREMNVEVPGKVARRFKESRIVAFATAGGYAYTTVETGGSTEQSPTAPVGAYAESCLGREQAFAEVSREHGTPVCLIRLNYAVELRYGVLVDICSKVINGEPVDLTMGHLNLIWQGDAVDQIIRTVALAESPPRPINITGKGILSVRSLAEKFAQILDREVAFTGEEAETAWLSNPAWSHQQLGAPRTGLDSMIQWTAAWLTHGGQTHGKPTGFETSD